jgi:hypothetical protein
MLPNVIARYLSLRKTLLLFLSPFIPVRAFTLWTHTRLVFRVSRYPFVFAPLARVAVDANFLFSHNADYIPEIYTRQVRIQLHHVIYL